MSNKPGASSVVRLEMVATPLCVLREFFLFIASLGLEMVPETSCELREFFLLLAFLKGN